MHSLIFFIFFYFFIHEQLTGVSAVGGKMKGKSRAASERLGKLAFVCTPPEWANVVNLRAVLWCCASWSPPIVAPAGYKQSQQNMSGVARRVVVVVVEWRKTRAAGIGNDLLQTPSMINVKGFQFLICQSFQRSLTYAYLQPRRSHHSGRWSGTSKPITSRLCCGRRCQRCKLAHLQPFIMHCSKEQLVFLVQAWCQAM